MTNTEQGTFSLEYYPYILLGILSLLVILSIILIILKLTSNHKEKKASKPANYHKPIKKIIKKASKLYPISPEEIKAVPIYDLFRRVQDKPFNVRKHLLKAILNSDAIIPDIVHNGYNDSLDVVNAIIDPANTKPIFTGARKALQICILYVWSGSLKREHVNADITIVRKTLLSFIPNGSRESSMNKRIKYMEDRYGQHIVIDLYRDFMTMKNYNIESSIFCATDALSEFMYENLSVNAQTEGCSYINMRGVSFKVAPQQREIIKQHKSEFKAAIDSVIAEWATKKKREDWLHDPDVEAPVSITPEECTEILKTAKPYELDTILQTAIYECTHTTVAEQEDEEDLTVDDADNIDDVDDADEEADDSEEDYDVYEESGEDYDPESVIYE